MMMRSVPLPSSPSRFLLEPSNDLLLLRYSRSAAPSASTVGSSTICCSLRSYDSIPKLEHSSFSRSNGVFSIDPPLIQKKQNEIADYCMRLEGDPCYYCWTGYFELNELEKLAPKQEVERVIKQADSMKSLLGLVHLMLANYKQEKETKEKGTDYVNTSTRTVLSEEKMAAKRDFHVPEGGLPKSAEEVEEEEKARMPDSPFTRLLRVIGRRRDTDTYTKLFMLT